MYRLLAKGSSHLSLFDFVKIGFNEPNFTVSHTEAIFKKQYLVCLFGKQFNLFIKTHKIKKGDDFLSFPFCLFLHKKDAMEGKSLTIASQINKNLLHVARQKHIP